MRSHPDSDGRMKENELHRRVAIGGIIPPSTAALTACDAERTRMPSIAKTRAYKYIRYQCNRGGLSMHGNRRKEHSSRPASDSI